MAKDASDREDLLREATGFSQRIELQIANVPTSVFCGFRNNGAFSLYWGQETVIQFNTKHELRRGFWRDRMVASYKRHLHWLESEGADRVRLKRTAFTESESKAFLLVVENCLRELAESLQNQDLVSVVGRVPVDVEVEHEVLAWLQNLPAVQLAMHPGVGK